MKSMKSMKSSEIVERIYELQKQRLMVRRCQLGEVSIEERKELVKSSAISRMKFRG